MDRDFTFYLQDLINNQTNLSLTSTNGDLVYEGEITSFTIAPMAANAQQQAAQNRLSVTINVRFTNTKDSEIFQPTHSLAQLRVVPLKLYSNA